MSLRPAFSPAELRDIFTLKMTTDGCQTRKPSDISPCISTDVADDLLQCDCQTKAEALSEQDSNLPSPVKSTSNDSDDDQPKGFVNASQYDPAPVRLVPRHTDTR